MNNSENFGSRRVYVHDLQPILDTMTAVIQNPFAAQYLKSKTIGLSDWRHPGHDDLTES